MSVRDKYPELATLLADHLPVLHHVDRTLVDGVVCFVSQPILVTLTDGNRDRDVIRCVCVVVLAFAVNTNKAKQSETKPIVKNPASLTCLMAVTVMTKKSGSPLVMGLVGVSMINWREDLGQNKTA